MCNLISRSQRSINISVLFLVMVASLLPCTTYGIENFEGKFYSGQGDIEYLQLLEPEVRLRLIEHYKVDYELFHYANSSY